MNVRRWRVETRIAVIVARRRLRRRYRFRLAAVYAKWAAPRSPLRYRPRRRRRRRSHPARIYKIYIYVRAGCIYYNQCVTARNLREGIRRARDRLSVPLLSNRSSVTLRS